MQKQPVIRFEQVSKQFTFSTEKPRTVLETLTQLISRPTKQGQSNRNLWAVKDVTFDILPGQSLGLIGRNGSGKSTILKLTSRILRPSAGRITTNGRISALLELGAGFHPDLTGRENIYLNASILGFSREQTEAYYDSIVTFSELEDFIDMPVKHYSSGMYMRLGFSVAVHVNPDILIVDEILSVGDQVFQTKCLDRIFGLKESGATILIVSHDLNTIRQLCSHLIWMEHGRVRQAGPTQEVADAYETYTFGKVREARDTVGDGTFNRFGNQDIEITAVNLLDANHKPKEFFRTRDQMIIEIHYNAKISLLNPEFGLAIFRKDGIHINGPNTHLAQYHMGTIHGPGVIRYCIPHLPLLPGEYLLTTAVHHPQLGTTYDYHDKAYTFQVIPGGTNEFHGLIEMDAHWQWQGETA